MSDELRLLPLNKAGYDAIMMGLEEYGLGAVLELMSGSTMPMWDDLPLLKEADEDEDEIIRDFIASPQMAVPEVIAEEAFVDEETGEVTIREYDMNAPNSPPTCKQLIFPDSLADGCIAIDWTYEGQKALALAGVDFDIYDPDEAPKKTDADDVEGIDPEDNL